VKALTVSSVGVESNSFKVCIYAPTNICTVMAKGCASSNHHPNIQNRHAHLVFMPLVDLPGESRWITFECSRARGQARGLWPIDVGDPSQPGSAHALGPISKSHRVIEYVRYSSKFRHCFHKGRIRSIVGGYGLLLGAAHFDMRIQPMTQRDGCNFQPSFAPGRVTRDTRCMNV